MLLKDLWTISISLKQFSVKQEASAVLSRLEWYGMTFWTKLQHELLCFVRAEDEIFDSAGDRKKKAFPLSSRDVTK